MSETLLNGRYRLIAQQGSGGMAVIYKAIDQLLERTVAVKILRPSLTNDPEFLQRFKNEARNVANLSHPNIVTVYDVGNEGKTNYIVMEFIDGSDLKKLIRKQGALPIEEAVDLSIQICSGIGLAHRAGLVHADVKPQNVLLTSGRQVKVTDFGIAQAFNDPASDPQERQQVVWGSPHYFAPEQAKGEKPSPASDVYSIGIVMFEMLTGQLPYSGTDQQALAMAHIRDEIPRVTDINPQVPEALSRIVYKVMSKAPAQRYRMADQLGQILGTYRERGRQNTAVNPRVVSPAPQQMTPPPRQEPHVPPPPTVDSRYQRPSQDRPLYNEPPPREEESTNTQRSSIAPSAPQSVVYGSYGRGDNISAPTPLPPAADEYTGGSDTGAYTGPQRPPRQRSYSDESSGPDVITLVLAALALVAVSCLIPLYYLVYLSYR